MPFVTTLPRFSPFCPRSQGRACHLVARVKGLRRVTLTRVRYYFYYRASGKVLCRCLPSGTRGEVDSPTFDRNNAEPGAQPDCPKAAVRSAFGVPSARAALRQLVRSNYKGFPISCKCFSVSCSVFRLVHVLPACVVREDGGLRNYNRSCGHLARTLMKDARRGLKR